MDWMRLELSKYYQPFGVITLGVILYSGYKIATKTSPKPPASNECSEEKIKHIEEYEKMIKATKKYEDMIETSNNLASKRQRHLNIKRDQGQRAISDLIEKEIQLAHNHNLDQSQNEPNDISPEQEPSVVILQENCLPSHSVRRSLRKTEDISESLRPLLEPNRRTKHLSISNHTAIVPTDEEHSPIEAISDGESEKAVTNQDKSFQEKAEFTHLDKSSIILTKVEDAVDVDEKFLPVSSKSDDNGFAQYTIPKILQSIFSKIRHKASHSNSLAKIQNEIMEFEPLDDAKTELNLDNTSLTMIPFDKCYRLKNLRVLNLAYNNISIMPKEIWKLSKLEQICIRNNNLTEIPLFSQLPQLKVLDISNNKLKCLDSNTFIDSGIEVLNISKNLLAKLPTSIGYLNNLKSFFVDGNPLESHFQDLVDPLIVYYCRDERSYPFEKVKNLPETVHIKKIQSYLMNFYDLEQSLLLTPELPVAKEYKNQIDVEVLIGKWLVISNFLNINKRDRVISEIIETERKYIKDLLAIEDIYQLPLKTMKLFTDNEMDVLFSNIDDITNLHSKLVLPSLEILQKNGGKLIGGFFTKLVKFLKMYSLYMNTFDTTMSFLSMISDQILDHTKSNFFLNVSNTTCVEFNHFEKTVKKQKNHSQMNLAAFLILPIQRLPRYQLLLKSLMEATPKEHPDYENTRIALEEMIKIIDFCNENKRNAEFKQSTLDRLKHIIIPIESQLYLHLKPSPYRELIFEISNMCITKYVQLLNTPNLLEPNLLCKKKSQIVHNRQGPIEEYNFKFNQKSSDQLNIIDVFDYDGVSCSLFLCNDCLIVCSKKLVLVGYFELGCKSTAICLPIFKIKATSKSKYAVMRVSNGKAVIYIRGILAEIVNLVGLINFK
jgi:Leucine-rich repeat (LRR) protein